MFSVTSGVLSRRAANRGCWRRCSASAPVCASSAPEPGESSVRRARRWRARSSCMCACSYSFKHIVAAVEPWIALHQPVRRTGLGKHCERVRGVVGCLPSLGRLASWVLVRCRRVGSSLGEAGVPPYAGRRGVRRRVQKASILGAAGAVGVRDASKSPHVLPAINDDLLSGNKAGFIGEQHHYGVGDVSRPANPAERYGLLAGS
jgi:hypothetical protein